MKVGSHKTRISLAVVVAVVVVLIGGWLALSGDSSGSAAMDASGIHKIKHVVVIMQENRSFDTYFGTYPGADGIPMQNGIPTVCVPDAKTGQCVKPFVDHADVNGGGPHSQNNATADINGGKMDGFINQLAGAKQGCADPNDPACTNSTVPDVMGYHTKSDIPNYWNYADNFVLQDHMFEPNASWSLPEHLFQVSEWSASCTQHDNPGSCVNALQTPGQPPPAGNLKPTTAAAPIYAWTDMTYLLHKNKVSWGYYVVTGTEPDCEDDATVSCTPVNQSATTPGIWNPLPYFDTVKADNQLGNIQTVDNFYAAAKKGALPAVSWVVPSGQVTGSRAVWPSSLVQPARAAATTATPRPRLGAGTGAGEDQYGGGLVTGGGGGPAGAGATVGGGLGQNGSASGYQ